MFSFFLLLIDMEGFSHVVALNMHFISVLFLIIIYLFIFDRFLCLHE